MTDEILQTYSETLNVLKQIQKHNTTNVSRNIYTSKNFTELISFELTNYNAATIFERLLNDFLYTPNKTKFQKQAFINKLSSKLKKLHKSKFIDIPDFIDRKSLNEYIEEHYFSVGGAIIGYLAENDKTTLVARDELIDAIKNKSPFEEILLIYKHFKNFPQKYQQKFNIATCDYLRRRISIKITMPIITTELELLNTKEEDLNRRIERENIHKNLENDILEICVRLAERKNTKKLEDIINDDITDHLRSKKYNITDQTRSGSSLNGKDAGRLDIMVRDSKNLPLSIIEAFKISSIGLKNNIVSDHLTKLILKYDTTKLSNKYILVYSETQNFTEFSDKYCNYLKELKRDEKYKLDNVGSVTKPFGDDINCLRTIDTYHRINGVYAKIKHILIDFN